MRTTHRSADSGIITFQALVDMLDITPRNHVKPLRTVDRDACTRFHDFLEKSHTCFQKCPLLWPASAFDAHAFCAKCESRARPLRVITCRLCAGEEVDLTKASTPGWVKHGLHSSICKQWYTRTETGRNKRRLL